MARNHTTEYSKIIYKDKVRRVGQPIRKKPTLIAEVTPPPTKGTPEERMNWLRTLMN